MGALGSIESGRAIQVTGTGSPQLILPRDGIFLYAVWNSGGTTPTMSLYDAATVGAAASGNQFLTAMPLVQSNVFNLRAALTAGLVATITAGAIVTFVCA